MTSPPADPAPVAADDARLLPYLDLRAERDRRHESHFICEGTFCIRRALDSGLTVRSLLTTAAQLETLRPLLRPGIDVLVGDNALLQRVTGFKFHRGCLAAVDKPAFTAPDFSALAARPRSTVVFAEAVSNPSNMGALIRNCASFGVDALVLTPSSADPFSRRAVRTAMGNGFSLPMGVVVDAAPAIAAYRAALATHAPVVYAATLGANAISLDHLPARPAHTGVVVGSENQGLLPETIAACTAEVIIPMVAGADSLNVAAASAVLLYALR